MPTVLLSARLFLPELAEGVGVEAEEEVGEGLHCVGAAAALGELLGAVDDDVGNAVLLVEPVGDTVYRKERPRLSCITAVFGLVGLGAFLLVMGTGALISLFSANPPAPPEWATWLFMSLFTLVSIWLMLAAILGWRTDKLPSGLTGIMATSGFSWFIIFLGIWGSDLVNHVAVKQLTAILGTELIFWLITHPVWAAVKQLSSIIGIGLTIWLITHPIWTVWLGVWFWQQPNSFAPQGDLETN